MSKQIDLPKYYKIIDPKTNTLIGMATSYQHAVTYIEHLRTEFEHCKRFEPEMFEGHTFPDYQIVPNATKKQIDLQDLYIKYRPIIFICWAIIAVIPAFIWENYIVDIGGLILFLYFIIKAFMYELINQKNNV